MGRGRDKGVVREVSRLGCAELGLTSQLYDAGEGREVALAKRIGQRHLARETFTGCVGDRRDASDRGGNESKQEQFDEIEGR